MRYQNWDVLLFEGVSKTPQQEFKTGCYAILDPETQFHGSGLTGLPYPLEQSVPLQMPAVTCFIPSLVPGSPFRLSLHSWEPPTPSKALQNIAGPKDLVLIEARVLIDGFGISAALYNPKSRWPQVIDFVTELNKAGQSEILKFPPFHSEILYQDYWNVAEDLGRVKIVLAEGMVRQYQGSSFERIRNIVVFSFQHAPLDVLEHAGIAYPNQSMWRQLKLPAYSAQALSPSKMSRQRQEHGFHTHTGQEQVKARGFGRFPPTPYHANVHGAFGDEPDQSKKGFGFWPEFDPFVETSEYFKEAVGTPTRRPQVKSDQTMSDYEQLSNPQNSSAMPSSLTNMDMGDSAADGSRRSSAEIQDGRREGSSGTIAPSNTRDCSLTTGPNVQNMIRSSVVAAVEGRYSSYSQASSSSQASSGQAPTQPSQRRVISDSNSSISGLDLGSSSESQSVYEIPDPAGLIKGRKEGRESGDSAEDTSKKKVRRVAMMELSSSANSLNTRTDQFDHPQNDKVKVPKAECVINPGDVEPGYVHSDIDDKKRGTRNQVFAEKDVDDDVEGGVHIDSH